ncbi:MAG: hypothetical protein H0X35_11460 [Pseudonocardiales bacterium]|nr:hypothetical protein [Pseudonocardiales bacterium]
MPAPIFDDDPPVVLRPSLTTRQVRDLVGLVLVVLGAIGLIVAAWLWAPLAGLATASVACVVGGLALGYDW